MAKKQSEAQHEQEFMLTQLSPRVGRLAQRKSALITGYTVTEEECALLIIFGFLSVSPSFNSFGVAPKWSRGGDGGNGGGVVGSTDRNCRPN